MEKTTDTGLEALRRQMSDLIERRDAIAMQIGGTCDETNITHDNFPREQLERDRDILNAQILTLARRLSMDFEIIVAPNDLDTVRIGVTVKMRSLDEDLIEDYTILGDPDSDPGRGVISHNSPLGRALIGRRVGDEVQVYAPQGSYLVIIESIYIK